MLRPIFHGAIVRQKVICGLLIVFGVGAQITLRYNCLERVHLLSLLYLIVVLNDWIIDIVIRSFIKSYYLPSMLLIHRIECKVRPAAHGWVAAVADRIATLSTIKLSRMLFSLDV